MESPTKARTIKKFLSSKYKVVASQGHLIDLPRSKLGVDIENKFEPQYITIRGKGKILSELKSAGKKASRIFLAADPDREGEAICWHIGRALKMDFDQPCRVEFHEITKEAIKEAFKNPRLLDMNRVDAQQARRVLDRLVGYQISPLLWRKIRGGLSAGRVQSVAVRMICDREEEIERFVPEEYWSIEALLDPGTKKDRFKAQLERYKGKKVKPASREEAASIIGSVEKEPFTVEQVRRSERRRRPLPPFTTSSLQQEASSKLGFTSRKTMSVAQQLYEGISIGSKETVGLVTYIRTDSTRVADQAAEDARSLVKERFGQDFVPAKPPRYKSKKGAQEAHEAIRPTGISRAPEQVEKFLSKDQNRLYKLIWDRFVASQMSPALYDQVRVKVSVGDYTFKSVGSTLRFPGFLLVYSNNDQGEEVLLPDLEEGQNLELIELIPDQHFTQPPPRYNEASLIKTLEEKGIGRPSTYSPIIETIQSRGYVRKENKAFVPTDLGIVVVKMMLEFFPEVMDIDFTARLEKQLDDVEVGQLEWLTVLDEFYNGCLKERLAVADEKIEKVELEPEVSEETCPQCGKNLQFKHGRFGRFLACPSYPECKYTKKIVNDTGVSCPKDGGNLIERRSRKGRVFYGCSNYPECDFSLWNKPLSRKCSECGSIMVEAAPGKNKVARCSNKECPNSKAPAKEKVTAAKK